MPWWDDIPGPQEGFQERPEFGAAPQTVSVVSPEGYAVDGTQPGDGGGLEAYAHLELSTQPPAAPSPPILHRGPRRKPLPQRMPLVAQLTGAGAYLIADFGEVPRGYWWEVRSALAGLAGDWTTGLAFTSTAGFLLATGTGIGGGAGNGQAQGSAATYPANQVIANVPETTNSTGITFFEKYSAGSLRINPGLHLLGVIAGGLNPTTQNAVVKVEVEQYSLADLAGMEFEL